VVLKRRVRTLLVDSRVDEVAALAGQTRRVLGLLIALTFDRDPVIAWRAIAAMGVAATRIAPEDPEAIRELLRRLNWLITEESGGICWHAPEAMAEIVRAEPERYADFVPIVVHLLVEAAEEDLHHFRPGMLWAIGRLGPVAAAHLTDVLPAMTAALDHPDPQVRGTAVWALRQVERSDLVDRAALRADDGAVVLFEDGTLTRTTVSALARAAAVV
jgi:hypothetical protein